ncbi:MAG TPA: LPS export ABC transporter permease LptF [Steroidobacteraceae bacterium]|nr:LPS export ABC transporter permease LptF [Steroidobacteraceae bacterium]
MLRILDRYILREVVVSWLSVSGVLLVIMLTNQVARVLERAADSQYPRGVVFELILMGAVQNLTLVIPIALLLGIVLALGRLYHDSELTAAQACGARRRVVMLPVMAFTAVLTALLAFISLQVSPAATGRMLDVRREALRAGQFAPISAGKFSTFGGGSTVVYAQAADKDGTLRRVFVQRTRGNVLEIALAQRATHAYSEGGDLQVITLYDGERYEGIPGERRFRIVRFAENTIPVRLPALSGGSVALEGLPTSTLMASSDRAQLAELHWRLAFPVMGVVMALIAVPLARLRPRQGRYARVGFAILIFFVYIELAIAGKFWIQRGVMPAWLGLWWVHAAVGLFGAALIVAPRWLARLRYRRNMAGAPVPSAVPA